MNCPYLIVLDPVIKPQIETTLLPFWITQLQEALMADPSGVQHPEQQRPAQLLDEEES